MTKHLWAVAVSLALAAGFVGAALAEPLPEGDRGIAASYPGDEGIRSAPGVIFADDFESYSSASALSSNWSSVYHNARIATEPGNSFAGSRALEFRCPQQSAELSNSATKLLSPKRDLLFVRFYSKYDPHHNVNGSSHNGVSISANYFANGQASPGVPANGTNKFLANFEALRMLSATPSAPANPGELGVYVYQPEQRQQYGDWWYPTGMVLPNSSQPGNFGSEFVARPNIVPELGRWYSFEFMLKANTPGQRDGRIACWLDGKLIADFPNLRLRDIETLKIDRFELQYHIGSNTGGESRKWYDNVVAASSYIGPLRSASSPPPPPPASPPKAPTGLTVQPGS